MWKNRGNDGSLSKPIVIQTGKELVKPIDNAFGHALNYDSPDYKMREVLKQNIWDFSVAKNYNDNIALNNLLINDDGKLRSWSDFKHEAQKVVGRSNRYLRTEYNTVVAGSQMSRLWQDIQRDKSIFPYAAFDVVDDGRTSEICAPLKDVVVSVDDPFLAHYFPPNHFNCRTTVRRLRNGTVQYPKDPLEIPESFQNNVGQTGEIFTKENDYINNTPKSLQGKNNKIELSESRKEAMNEAKTYTGNVYEAAQHDVKITKKGLNHAISQNHDDYMLKNSLIKTHLKEIIEEAEYVQTSPDNKGRSQFTYHYYKVKGYDNMYIVLREVQSNKEVQFYSIVDDLK